MRYKPTDKKTTILILIVALIAVLFAKQAGFASTRSATRIGYTTNEGWSNWSASYFMLDGTLQKNVHTEDGTLVVSTETKSGTISIQILDTDGKLVFDQANIGTDSFEVELSGKATIRITASNHRGSFNIVG